MVEMVGGDAFYTALGEDQKVRIRLIDCVGYLVKDASGHAEEGDQRTGDILADTATIGIIHL